MPINKVKEVVDMAIEKSEPVIRKARSAAEAAAKKAEPVLEAAKNAGKQVVAVFVPEIYVQYASRQYDSAILVERCKEDFKAKHPGTMIRSCKLYIKPEDGMVYYVINDIEDNAFAGCNNLSYIDATALEDYTPTTLTREFDGPFSGVPAQSLVYLNGTNVTGENYIYKVGDGDFRCEELKIYDDVSGAQTSFTETNGHAWAFENKYEFKAATLTNTRQLNNGKHYTTCLPYPLQLPATLKAYTYIGTGTNMQIVGFNEVTGTIEAYTPYVIIPSASGNLLSTTNVTIPVTPDAGTDEVSLKRLTTDDSGELVFYGTVRYIDGAEAENCYIMQGDKNWKKITGESSYSSPCILPMRAFISPRLGGSARELLSTVFYNADNTTTVKDLRLDADDSEIYDLQGRKMDSSIKLQKGVYIVNGVKRIKK